MGGERKISSNVLYKGRIINLKVDNVVLPSGKKAVREVVEHAPAVAVLATDPDGRILLVKQERYAVAETLLEIPAGIIEPGETVRETAARELREETGYEPLDLEEVLRFYTSPGFSTEMIVLFSARRLKYAPLEQDYDEDIAVERIDPESLRGYLESGMIRDAKTIAALCWYLHHEHGGNE